METTLTKVVIDTRVKQIESKVSATEVMNKTNTSLATFRGWLDKKAPDLIVGIFKQAQATNSVIDLDKLSVVDNGALNFLKQCKKEYGWEFMDIVKEVKI